MALFKLIRLALLTLAICLFLISENQAWQIREIATAERGDSQVLELIDPFLQQARAAMELRELEFYETPRRQLIKDLSVDGLGDALLRYLETKPEDISEVELPQLEAYANEILGNKKVAVEGYRNAILSDAKLDAIRMRLLLLEKL